MDLASGLGALPVGPLPHGGPDQPPDTQVHEPGHGPALAGERQEAPGYGSGSCYMLTDRTLQNSKAVLLPPGTRKSFDHLISDSKAPKRPEMESGMTTPPKMRRVAENDYEIGEAAARPGPAVGA